MKKLLCLILGFTFLLRGPVYAEEYHPDVSPAIEILRRQTKLRKSTSLESSIQFNKEEFSRLVGKGATHVTVLDLPEGGGLALKRHRSGAGTAALPS